MIYAIRRNVMLDAGPRRSGGTRGGKPMTSDTDTKLIVPGLQGLYETLAPRGYALIRFVTGAILVYHGYVKLFHGFAPVVADKILTPLGFPVPLAWAYWLGILEFVGGAFEYPFLLMILSIGFLFHGSGRCSIDRSIGREF